MNQLIWTQNRELKISSIFVFLFLHKIFFFLLKMIFSMACNLFELLFHTQFKWSLRQKMSLELISMMIEE